MEKFTISPDQNGYSFSDPTEVLTVQLDGGAGKYRSDIINGTKKLNCNWTFNKDDFNYFRCFYQFTANKGALPFLMDLYIDDPFELTEHECRFIPGSIKLGQQRGEMFLVSASLEVKPIPISQENQDYAYFYGAFGNQIDAYDVLFDQLVTYEFPQDLS